MFSCAHVCHIVYVFPIVLLGVCAGFFFFFFFFFSDRLCIMAPKRDLSEKDAPGKEKARKSITMEQKMDILRRYDRGESTAAIRNMLNLPESMLRTIREDREKIMAAVKAGAGSCAMKVSSGQSTVMVRMEKMMVMWMDHRKRQGLKVTFNDTKKKAMECYNHLRRKEMDPIPEFNASTG